MAEVELAAELLRSSATDDLAPLVSPIRRAQILRLAERFALPVRAVGYECRLAARDARVDYNLAFFAGVRQSALFAFLAEQRLGVAWERVLALVQPWAAGSSVLTAYVPFICAAFDEEPDADGFSAPSLSLCVDPEFYVRKLSQRLARLPPAHVLRVAEGCAGLLGEAALSQTAHSRLLHYLSADEMSEARHLSVMTSRSPSPMKLDVRLPVSRLSHFLAHCGFARRADALTAEVGSLLPDLGQLQLNLPLDANSETTVEVEVLTDRMDASTGARVAFLDRLVARGWASQAKAETLAQIWRAPRCPTADGGAVARSWYVKLRFHADGSRDAKAYVGLLPHGSAASPLGLMARRSDY